jgi:hypothetical protein
VFVNPFLVNAYRRKKPEGAHVIVSHRLAENGLAVTMIHTGTSFPGRHISAIRVPAPPRKSTAARRRSRQASQTAFMDSARW